MNLICRTRAAKRKCFTDDRSTPTTFDEEAEAEGKDESEGNHDPRLSAKLREKGHDAMRQGQLQTAVQIYSQALQHETTVPLLCQRAEAYLRLGIPENAIQDCTRVIRLQPKAWQAYALRASAFRERNDFTGAIADFRQAKMLCARRATHLEKLLVRCKRDFERSKRSQHLEALIEEGRQQPARPFVRGDKRVTAGQVLHRVQESLQVIQQVLDSPGSGYIIWKQDEMDRWKRVRTTNSQTHLKQKEEHVDYDNLVTVQRLEMLQYCLRCEAGQEVRLMLGSDSGFSTLLAAYEHDDLVVLVLDIIHEALRDGDDLNINTFLRSRPLPFVAQAFQDSRAPVRSTACALLDLIATYKSQQTLTLLLDGNLIPLLLKTMRKGSPAEHGHSISLFLKLAFDPRLVRHLSTLPSLHDLCEGLSRACRAGTQLTRLRGAQAITLLLEFEMRCQSWDLRASRQVVSPGLTTAKSNIDCNARTLCTAFADGGVLKAVALLLAWECEQVPEKAEVSPSIWEEDVELVCNEIANNVSDFSEMHECKLRDFNLLSGHAQIVVLSAVRAVEFMASTSPAIEVLDQMQAWGLFIPLLSSFPDKLAAIAVKILAKFCQRSKQVAMHIANLWPANSSLIVLELARFAQRCGDTQTYQAAMVILAELAACKSFLASMQKPTSFTFLVDFLQDRKSTTVALTAVCTCLTVAVTSCNVCVEFAEVKAYALGNRLLELWCEYRAEPRFRWQVENLMFVLMDRSGLLQQAILCLLQNVNPSNASNVTPGKNIVHYYNRQSSTTQTPSRDKDVAGRCLAFSQNRTNFQTICSFLSTLVQPSTKFADLCAWAGLLSIQVAKHFKNIHCYSVNRKRSLVEHTRRLARQEAVQNLTAVLCKSFDKLPNTLPGDLDVAILCLSLDLVDDLGRLFRAIVAKLQHRGKLVLIDDKEQLIVQARLQAALHGMNVLVQSTIAGEYSVLLLQRSTEL